MLAAETATPRSEVAAHLARSGTRTLNLQIRSYWQAHPDQLFQQVTGPYTSARVHPYAPGLLYSAAVPVHSSTGRAWPRSWRWSTLASAPLPTLPV